MIKHYHNQQWINSGTDQDCTIGELAQLIAQLVGYEDTIRYDSTIPDGTVRKLLEVSLLDQLGWQALTFLRNGVMHK